MYCHSVLAQSLYSLSNGHVLPLHKFNCNALACRCAALLKDSHQNSRHVNVIHTLQAEAAAGSVPNQDLTAMKLRLANAVQRSAGSSSDSEKRSQASEGRDTLLDDLLALPPPQHSRSACIH